MLTPAEIAVRVMGRSQASMRSVLVPLVLFCIILVVEWAYVLSAVERIERIEQGAAKQMGDRWRGHDMQAWIMEVRRRNPTLNVPSAEDVLQKDMSLGSEPMEPDDFDNL